HGHRDILSLHSSQPLKSGTTEPDTVPVIFGNRQCNSLLIIGDQARVILHSDRRGIDVRLPMRPEPLADTFRQLSQSLPGERGEEVSITTIDRGSDARLFGDDDQLRFRGHAMPPSQKTQLSHYPRGSGNSSASPVMPSAEFWLAAHEKTGPAFSAHVK